jgi:hypothetical protein
MPFWISRPAEAATGPDIDRAYEHGQRDARARDTDIDAAYEKGRRDARAERKRHPIGMALLVVLAAVGAIMIALAAMNGSFSDAGVVADQGLDTAAERAAPVVEDAARDAGEAVRETGRNLANRT